MENIIKYLDGDETTAERILLIIQGLWNGLIKIKNDNSGWLVCGDQFQLGYASFPFIGGMDYCLTPEELRTQHDIFSVAKMILRSIVNLDEDDYTYYCDLLGF